MWIQSHDFDNWVTQVNIFDRLAWLTMKCFDGRHIDKVVCLLSCLYDSYLVNKKTLGMHTKPILSRKTSIGRF